MSENERRWRGPWTLIVDENGKFSTARFAFLITLAVTLRVVYADVFGTGQISELSASTLSTLLIALIAWAGGPRLAEKLLTTVISTIPAAFRGLRGRTQLDPEAKP